MIARMLLSATVVQASVLAVLLAMAAASAAAEHEVPSSKTDRLVRTDGVSGVRTAQAAAEKFRWRWEKVIGPGEHPWTMTWRSSNAGPGCEHTGEGQFCGCSNTSACGRYDNGQEITTAPFGCDKPERWRLRCTSQRQ